MELDEQTGLHVPQWWDEREAGSLDLLDYVQVDASSGRPTIFLMIASYRDFQCRETITSALSREPTPRLFFA